MKSGILITLLFLSSLTYAQTFITNDGIKITNSALVTTNGSWSNAAGTVVVNNGRIATTEEWTNDGSLSGTGSFILNYAIDKNFNPGLAGAVIGSIQTKGGGAQLIANKIQITDTLILAGGRFKPLNASDTVFLNSALVLAGPLSYIELQDGSSATIAHSGTGDKLFPLGKGGVYLPIKLYKFNASKATARVEDAPGGYAAGPGVDDLINFPYVWKVDEKTASDTSAYVEVSYPDALTDEPVIDIGHTIVVREIPGSEYASMGSRLRNQNGIRETIKSYSRRLKGTYTIAKGFPGDFVTDSLALVALYNTTNGSGWTNKSNWLTGEVETWFGVTVTGQSITAVNLSGNKLSGSVPDPLVDILSLQNVNLSNNKITSIPNFTDNEEISTLNVSGNNLEFGALEANSALLDPGITFNYVNQADLGIPEDKLVDVGTAYAMTAVTEGQNNTYQWKRNGIPVSGANAKTFTIGSIARETMGEYICEVNNNLFPGLTLKTAKQKLTAIAKLSGKLFATDANAASKGKMTLFKINEKGKYDTTAVKNVNSDGSYLFEKIIVDDYQLVGFVDTLTYPKALPTYYSTNTVYWEEAQTIAVNSNLNNLNIVSAYVPKEVPKGVGIISGYLEEQEVPGGRGEVSKRVSGAGASVRRVDNVARPEAEKLTLVAYVFTNEEGEFELPELPNADYRLNIQYPGYPMDKTSFIDITIGSGLASQVRVAASVEDNKIKVTKLVVTGVWEKDGLNVQVYPNPSADRVVVRFPDASPTRTIELVNMLSEKLSSQAATQKENSLNVSQFAAGMYLLQVREKGEVVKTVRIAKE